MDMYRKKVHHVYYKVHNSNQYDDNKMFSGNSVLSTNNQTPCKTNVMYYRRNEYHVYLEIASDITTRGQ
jgi:hypothetical protein